MESARQPVKVHYGRGQIFNSILQALRDMGKDTAKLAPIDLAPVDEFDIRGREATVELANRASLTGGVGVLDVGCGLGGSVRYLASERQCRAVGVDLTKEYVEVANALAQLVGLKELAEFRQSSALERPFAGGSFDVVWTEHVQMNIADKRRFYGEIARVLAPGGRLVFHDVFQDNGGDLYYPVPWAEEPSISFLVAPETARKIIQECGFKIRDWEDKSHESLEWFNAAVERLKSSGPPPLGLHLLMGSTARAKFDNNIRNLTERRFVVIQAVAEKA